MLFTGYALMEEKLKLLCPVVVEGKYDKARVCQVVSSAVITLDGFSVFRDEEKKLLLSRLSKEKGIILLTDSDRAGVFLRSRLKGMLNGGKIYNVFAPAIKGKEKRKAAPSADGILGIEATDKKTIRELLIPFASESAPAVGSISKQRMYQDGLSGGSGSSQKRAKLCKKLGLPETLSANALLEAINLLISDEEYKKAVDELEI